MIQNPSKDSARSSYDKLKTNAVICISAQAPAADLAGNWLETVPGKDFCPMFRFHTPKEGLFDGTWKLRDFGEERILPAQHVTARTITKPSNS